MKISPGLLLAVLLHPGHLLAQAPAALPAPSEPLPAVEEMASGDAVVYQFPATAPGEPTVVFVVDRNADI